MPGLALAFFTGAFFPSLAGAATVELISKASTDELAAFSSGSSIKPVLSADGRYVAFLSSKPDLVPGQEDEERTLDVFLHDRLLGTTTLVSHAAGSPTRAASPGISITSDSDLSLDISADGRYVVFSNPGVGLVPGADGGTGSTDGEMTTNIFVWDRVTGTTSLVSHTAGAPSLAADGSSSQARISADGNFVVFTSYALNLVAGQSDQTNTYGSTTTDVFLWSRLTDTTTLVSRRSGTPATTGNKSSFTPDLSADGGVVVFTTAATDLLPNFIDLDAHPEVYAWQRATDTLSLVSRAATSPQVMVGASQEGLAVSADGRYVAFSSYSANLVPGQVDEDGLSIDLFLYDRTTGEMRLVSHQSPSLLLAGGSAFNPNGIEMSADGRYVAFSSDSANLAPGQVDVNKNSDVFVYDRGTGVIALASHSLNSVTTASTGYSSAPRLSADGRFLAFHSFSLDLVLGQIDVPPNNGASGTLDVFLYDSSSRSVTLMSHTRASSSHTANQGAVDPVLSADGGVAAFLSTATDLDEGQVNPYGFVELFLYRRTSGEITRASRHDPSLPPPITSVQESALGSVSADGRLLVYRTLDELFLRDTVTDTTVRITPPPGYSSRFVRGRNAVLSADGRFVALAAVQDSGNGSAVAGLYLYDVAAGTFILVNQGPGQPPLNSRPEGFPVSFALNADGRYLAYECKGCFQLRSFPSDNDVFLYDRVSGRNIRISHEAHAIEPAFPANGPSYSPAISADGRYVVYWSFANDLFFNQVDGYYTMDLFVFDREAGPVGASALITHVPGLPRTSVTTLLPDSRPPFFLPPAALSADGRFIAFESVLPNLVEGQVDTNEGADVFLYNQGTRTNTLVSHAASSPLPSRITGNAPSASPGFVESTVSMSADGRFIAYQSLATDLAAGTSDTNGASDVFFYDRLLGTNSLVSYGGTPRVAATGASGFPRISADGRRVAFTSTAADLLPGQTVPAGWHNLYVQEPGSGARTFIARAFRSSQDVLRSFVPSLSADGRRIGFNTEASLAPGDYNSVWDVYLWDQDGGEEPAGPISVPPCRLLDTRRRDERPILTSNVQRTVAAHNRCGVPATAKEIVVKVSVFNPSGKGNLRLYPGAVTGAPAAILRFERGTTRTETFTLPLGTNGTLTILPFVADRGTVHVAVEVTAYSNQP